MDVVLRDIPGITTLLDNVIIGGLNPTDHSKRLCQVLEHHQEAGLKLDQPKCQNGVKSDKFLDFQVDELGIHPTDDKVLAIKNALLKIKKESLSFLGLYHFYERDCYHRIRLFIEPLYRLLDRCSAWEWRRHRKKRSRRQRIC